MQENVLFARQPIFDRKQRVFGYELLFRNGEADRAQFLDGDLATRSVLLNAYAENSAPQLLNGKPGFLNVSRTMMSALPSFAKQFMVVEVLEQEHGHDHIVEALENLKQRRFRVALDDFSMADYQPELIDAADIVKLDVLQYDEAGLAQAVDRLRDHSVKLLAEKVETPDMFRRCEALGFDLFQGYFFCRPELIRGHILDANRRAIFDLIRELYQPEVDVSRVTDIVRRDVVLSYKLLKLVNSSFYRRAQQVDSITQAIMLLGVDRIRSWSTLVSLGKLNHKPDELQKESLMRAYMCEKLAATQPLDHQLTCFSAGLLSCLDAWFDYPLVQLMDTLPLSETLRDAVVAKAGPVGRTLALVIQYMHSQWHDIDDQVLGELGLTMASLSEAYVYAIEHTDQISILLTEE
ncbi:EAL and HDOD domain-containing protein [Reinekea blandensis]|uniref:Predicted signal transduction protein containing EAL and modified HD-GYP domains n=1 Tax=Reinekea blandensis MED297 TaxID=314283 RepID=A4BJJ2_9GAMM|nr:HDOD domain-containing protein [Reinekea blandensis]EAR07696.1 predicted signal transduction protein containing EAL and modified HD-GYP domains [Reinekea sp. MED297] [Reinekea blandensis MED297]